MRLKGIIRNNLMSEPGRLALYVAPGRLLGKATGLIAGDFPRQMTQQMGNTEGFHGRQGRIQLPFREALDLLERTLIEHLEKAGIAGRI